MNCRWCDGKEHNDLTWSGLCMECHKAKNECWHCGGKVKFVPNEEDVPFGESHSVNVERLVSVCTVCENKWFDSDAGDHLDRVIAREWEEINARDRAEEDHVKGK